MEHRFATLVGTPLPSDRRVRRPVEPAPSARSPLLRTGAALPDNAAVWSALLSGRTGDVPQPLSAAELATLSALGQLRLVAQGQPVFSHRSTASTLVALREGEVALGLRTADGTFRTERIVRGPAWLDLGSAWLDAPHAMDAQALTGVSLLELPREALDNRLADHPGLAQRLIRSLAREVQALTANTHELMHKDAPARLAQWLHQRLEQSGAASAGADAAQAVVRLHERKRDVASQLAITPETLSRLMRSFVRQGVIEVAGYTVRILDTAALARLAAG